MRNTDFQSLDLSERRTLACRELVERLQRRVLLLNGQDRVLMEMYLDGGLGIRQIAKLVGASPSTVTRRLRRIVLRLSDETYFRCMQYRWRFADDELLVLRDHFLQGRSIVRISRSRRLSRYRIARAIRKARRIARETCAVRSS